MQYQIQKQIIEVNGRTILSVLDGMGSFASYGVKFLQSAGLPAKIDPDSWYPRDAWLRAFDTIANKIGERTLKMIGSKIPENADFPPFVVDIHSALKSINIAYHMNHSKDPINKTPMFDGNTGQIQTGIGDYIYKSLGRNKAAMKCINPYPCDFDMGIVHAMARRFKKGALINHVPGKCRKKGDTHCIYEISWI